MKARIWILLVLTLSLRLAAQSAAAPTVGEAQVKRAVGTIKSMQADRLVLTPDAGGELTATLSSSTKILRVPPGETDLKNAAPLQIQDLQAGDRVLVRGRALAGADSIAALAVIVMKQGDVSAKREHDREDWQKRGVGGPVTAVDATAGTITISSAGAAQNRSIVIHTAKKTSVRRYAPDSVKFDDARSATVDQIRVGDQLRARGNRSPDGSELTAEDIVFGSFRSLAGTITAIDSASNAMTVQDAIGATSVVVKVSADSQIKKLPVEMAQRMAMRLKSGAGADAGQGGASGPKPEPPPGNASSENGKSSGRPGAGPGAPGQNGNGSLDLQRLLGRMPAGKLADLQKGDAVMIVATQGNDPGTVTAITVLAGVEPILTAAPNHSAMTLSPWSLSAGGGEGESAP